MKDISQKILFDQLTDFANKYGDQALLDLLNEWQLINMGENSPEKGGAHEK